MLILISSFVMVTIFSCGKDGVDLLSPQKQEKIPNLNGSEVVDCGNLIELVEFYELSDLDKQKVFKPKRQDNFLSILEELFNHFYSYDPERIQKMRTFIQNLNVSSMEFPINATEFQGCQRYSIASLSHEKSKEISVLAAAWQRLTAFQRAVVILRSTIAALEGGTDSNQLALVRAIITSVPARDGMDEYGRILKRNSYRSVFLRNSIPLDIQTVKFREGMRYVEGKIDESLKQNYKIAILDVPAGSFYFEEESYIEIHGKARYKSESGCVFERYGQFRILGDSKSLIYLTLNDVIETLKVGEYPNFDLNCWTHKTQPQPKHSMNLLLYAQKNLRELHPANQDMLFHCGVVFGPTGNILKACLEDADGSTESSYVFVAREGRKGSFVGTVRQGENLRSLGNKVYFDQEGFDIFNKPFVTRDFLNEKTSH